MLRNNSRYSTSQIQTLIPPQNRLRLAAAVGINVASWLPIPNKSSLSHKKKLRLRRASTGVKAVLTSTDHSTTVKTVVTVLHTVGAAALSDLDLEKGLDKVADRLGRTLSIELVAAELDAKSGMEKPRIQGHAKEIREEKKETYYEASFRVPPEFGEIGAITVENEHHREMFIKSIVLEGIPYGPVNMNCESWVHPKTSTPERRIFFCNKSYLPSQTPNGLEKLREKELRILRGDGTGERKSGERIYDYDVYNDLGDPDKDEAALRPVLGGPQRPYPRRCRTGRPKTQKDPWSESKAPKAYVPRDEVFSQVKEANFGAKSLESVLHSLIPTLESTITDPDQGFPYFSAIDSLFNEGVLLPNIPSTGFLCNIIPRIVKAITDTGNAFLRFEVLEFVDRDKFSWLRDAEFARQTLAGINPCAIKLVTEWPLKSELDPEVYGPAESAITTDIVEREIRGFMTVEEARAGVNGLRYSTP